MEQYRKKLKTDNLLLGAAIVTLITVQVLAYLEKMRASKFGSHCLLVVPASLLGNWQKEAEKFYPIYEDRPFAHMDQLGNAKFYRHSDQAGIIIKTAKDPQGNDRNP